MEVYMIIRNRDFIKFKSLKIIKRLITKDGVFKNLMVRHHDNNYHYEFYNDWNFVKPMGMLYDKKLQVTFVHPLQKYFNIRNHSWGITFWMVKHI
jgi:hypothetical protein